MNIEEALQKITEAEPIYEDGYGFMNCIYCHGDGYPVAHDSDCPWLYLKQQVEEDKRIRELFNKAYPGLFPPQ